MTKKIIFIICLAVAAAVTPINGFSQEQGKVSVDKIVANVGNSVILYSDVVETEAQLIESYRMNGYTPPNNTFYAAFEHLLEIKLGYNQALIDSLTINDADLATYVEEVVQQQVNEAGSVKALQAEYNMPIFEIKSMVYKRLQEQEYYKTMKWTASGGGKIQMTPGEVEAYYKSFPKDSIPIIPDKYMYAQITKYPPSMTVAKQQLRERMVEMRADIISGKSKFETMAILYSADEESGKRGGELLYLTSKNEMNEAFRNAIRKLKPGQISEVTESDNGLHLIEIMEIVGDRYRIRHIMMTPSYTSDEKISAVRLLDSLATKIRQDSTTFQRAALEFSDDKETKMNGGIVTNSDMLNYYYGADRVSAGMKSFRIKKDDFIGPYYRDYQVLMELKPGEVSDAYLTTDFKGNAQAKIIKLIEFFPAHDANLADDYLDLEEKALNMKMTEAYNKWLDKTIRSTYIRIDPAYRDGLDPKWLK